MATQSLPERKGAIPEKRKANETQNRHLPSLGGLVGGLRRVMKTPSRVGLRASTHLDEFIQAWYRIFGKLNLPSEEAGTANLANPTNLEDAKC